MITKKEMFKNYQNEMQKYEDHHDEINPLDVMESYFFGMETEKGYAETAIEKCINDRLNFYSTVNSVYEISKNFIKIKCPSCDELMKPFRGCGNGSEYTMNYRCVCGDEASISLPHDGISFSFKKF